VCVCVCVCQLLESPMVKALEGSYSLKPLEDNKVEVSFELLAVNCWVTLVWGISGGGELLSQLNWVTLNEWHWVTCVTLVGD